MWLTRLALKYPITTLMAAMAVFVLGFVSFYQLPIDMLPNLQIPVVTVITFNNGAGPIDMEQTVTVPIERAVSSTNDVDYVQSATREGLSQVRVFFNWDANTSTGLIDVIQKVNRVFNLLPPTASQPLVLRFDITNMPVGIVALSGDLDEKALYDLAYNVIEPQLEHVPGVAFAQVVGGKIREIQVRVDRNRIDATGLTLSQVMNAVSSSNLIVPSGDIKSGVMDYSLRTESRFNMVEPLGDVVIKTINNIPIRIRDVARVEDSFQEQSEIIRHNGKPGVILRVQKTSGANTVSVVNAVVKALTNLKDVPPSIKASLGSDQSLYIKQSISGLQQEAMLGAFLAMIIIILFLRNTRSAIIIFVAIPLSILATFIFFRFSGTSLNIMTFGGLALGIGRLVDDSIVELEAILRHYNTMGRDRISKMQATLDAAREVASPIFISTLTTVIVFLPVVFLTGIAQLLFVPLVTTISVALFGSFFVSRTVTPLMCYKYLNPEREIEANSDKFSHRIQYRAKLMLDWIDNNYESVLKSALRHRKLVIFSILIFSFLSFGLFKFIGSEFFPDTDESQFTVIIKKPVGTRIEETIKFVEKVEAIIKQEVPELVTMVSDVGVPNAKSGNLFGQNSGSHASNIAVSVVPPDERSRTIFEIIKKLRPKLISLPGAQVFVNTGGFLKFLLNFGSSAPIDIVVSGHDFVKSDPLIRQIADSVKTVNGATDVQITRELNLPELLVSIDRVKAGAAGVSIQQISNTIATAISGSVVSYFIDPNTGNQYNMLVRMQEDYRNKTDDIKNLSVANSAGQLIKLRDLINLKFSKSPIQIDRKYQMRIAEVTGNVTGRDLGSVVNDIKTKVAGISVPSGFQVSISGNIEQQQKTFSGLFLALLLAIVLVYMVMASQFQSLLDPFIIMFTVLLGVVGVLWALFITDTTLSVTSFEGVIVMIGIVVSNGILMVDYTNRLRKTTGLELNEAVIKASKTRLKPILMTSLATVLGLIPIALSIGGETSQAPLAIAVIGGLTASTFLTLLFVPCLYTVFETKFNKKIKEDDKIDEL
ncbi:MAG: efflux RND transporter permease subunit [Candidatus Kapabacteria bacterium]|nr:efflux RND transporter permease subunit [Candidatus Kapabacteria bacterium]